jgi:uncharacterized protein (DUF1330 family)
MTVYAIINYDLSDPDGYKQYMGLAAKAPTGGGLKLLALDPATKTIEGEPLGHQTVILEFPDEAAFHAWYDSPEYGEAKPVRFAATANHRGILVQGFAPKA